MNPEQFTACITRLDWSMAEAARRLGKAHTTITAYKRGEIPIPDYVSLVLCAYEQVPLAKRKEYVG